MADKGPIGTYRGVSYLAAGSPPPSGASAVLFDETRYFRPLPTYRASIAPSDWGHINMAGTLSGYVTENATPLFRAKVCCYWRDNGNLVSFALTDLNGAFSFPYLDATVAGYYIVAQDPPGGTQYNAKIYDYLTPV